MTKNILDEWRNKADTIRKSVKQVILGQDNAIEYILIAVFSRGHVLLEGDVGVGKTTLLRVLARTIGGGYERIEGTIDLMPNDLLYNTFIDSQGRPVMQPGPVIRQQSGLTTLFFNEINRARPQVHSLLLRVMAERSVQAFDETYTFPHLLVFADRNQIEREETFELPVAARDRFFMEINISSPKDEGILKELAFNPKFHDADKLVNEVDSDIVSYTEINNISELIQSNVQVAPEIERYVLALCNALRNPNRSILEIDGVDIQKLVKAGVSPRGMSMLVKASRVSAWLDDRLSVIPEDVHAVFPVTMGHRVFFTPAYEYRSEEIRPKLINAVLKNIPSP
ncbi:MAG: MoxR family ATPase [Proteobacteria bacterium]|nr:MoxR family ATPase [Pseudomonadota bacterium]